MSGQGLFVAQVVIAVEDQWFATGTDGPPVRFERKHYVESFLFAAPDAEEASRMACDWLPGFSDVNQDGPGDLTKYFALGLHQLEELLPRMAEFPMSVQEPYGIDVGLYDPASLDADGAPLVRSRDQLEVFRRPGLSRPQGDTPDDLPRAVVHPVRRDGVR